MEQMSVTDKYFMIAKGVTVERYSSSEIYNKLSEMNEFERRMLIKRINDAYGYEAVNYNLMKQQYNKEETQYDVVQAQDKSESNNAFSKDYMKAYMSMLSS